MKRTSIGVSAALATLLAVAVAPGPASAQAARLVPVVGGEQVPYDVVERRARAVLVRTQAAVDLGGDHAREFRGRRVQAMGGGRRTWSMTLENHSAAEVQFRVMPVSDADDAWLVRRSCVRSLMCVRPRS